MDNIRPIVPKWDASHTALLWLRGTYSTAQSYAMKVVGTIDDEVTGRPRVNQTTIGRSNTGQRISAEALHNTGAWPWKSPTIRGRAR